MDEFVFFKAENSCMYFHVEGFEGAQIKPGKDKILVIFVLEGDVAVDGMQSTTMHWKNIKMADMILGDFQNLTAPIFA